MRQSSRFSTIPTTEPGRAFRLVGIATALYVAAVFVAVLGPQVWFYTATTGVLLIPAWLAMKWPIALGINQESDGTLAQEEGHLLNSRITVVLYIQALALAVSVATVLLISLRH